MPQTEVRVVGSGFSTFNYNGAPIAWLQEVGDTGQKAGAGMGAPYLAIHPLGWRHPREIVTSRIVGAGIITLTIHELWNAPVWYQLAGLDGVGNTVIDIYEALANNPALVTAQTIIKPPGSANWRGTIYNNCVITDIDDAETITVGALSVARTINVAYTHKTPYTHGAAA